MTLHGATRYLPPVRAAAPLLAALLLAASATPAAAQGRLSWNGTPAVGSWVEMSLQVVADGKASSGSVKVSCLAKERRGGVDHLWIEVVRVKGKKQRILKLLLPESAVAGSDNPLSLAVEVVYQDAGKGAMKASGSQLASLVSLLETIQGETPLTHEPAGKEKLALPDGTSVSAERLKGVTEVTLPGHGKTSVQSELLTVPQVPFGIARRVLTTTEGEGVTATQKVETTTLAQFGTTGAATEIKGEVRPFSVLDLLSGK